jgi:hypothetical protein
MRIRFDEVAIRGVRRWIDENGKKHQETRKFYQTISPFNKGADGQPKSSAQILKEISAERSAWLREVKADAQ